MRWLLVLLLVISAAAVAVWRLPPAWQPWAPLDLREPPTPITGWKLARVADDPAACLAALATAELPVRRVADRPSDVGCDIANAVVLSTGVRLSPPGPTVTCPMAVAWTLFERHGLQPAARKELGTTVASVRHVGTYVCRNINHAAEGRRSQHATANAIDLSAFTLADGREISVLKHWGAGGPEARFLEAVRDGACRWFRGVLGPEFNRLHRDHFHLDRGRWSTCR